MLLGASGRQVIARQGNLFSRPQVLFDNIFSLGWVEVTGLLRIQSQDFS